MMKKIKGFCMLLAVLAVLGCLAGCGSNGTAGSDPAAEAPDHSAFGSINLPEKPESEPAPAEAAPAAPAAEAEYLPDFTVETIDGSTFTLSDALADHELVLINLFATWCPPCAMEFPFLQEAWSQCADRVAVIALSVEPEDSMDALRQYAAEKGLSFPMGREEGTDLERFVTEGIPTSVLVDHSGRILAVEVGAKLSVQEFLDWFDAYSSEDYDPDRCTYTVYVYDYDYEAVPGVVITFCTDTLCTPVTSDEEGVAVFTGTPARYHAQVVQSPEGWQPEGAADWYTEPYGQVFEVLMTEVRS